MKVLLGVTGSISAYRALDILRGLTKLGHEVSVILSKGALKFVVPNAFYYLGAREVYLPNSDFERERAGVLHIDLAREHDLFVIAPASANTLSKLATGAASDTLTSLLLALRRDRDVLLFPAMNPDMWASDGVVRNREILARRSNYSLFAPASGEMACGEMGEGKLPTVSSVVETIHCWPLRQERRGKRVLITTGATLAPLDPVRFLSNPSSGKTGVELARVFLSLGDQVTLIKGVSDSGISADLALHPSYREIQVKTTPELAKEVEREIKTSDIFISAGAPCDFMLSTTSEHKIKKDGTGLKIHFEAAPDILKWVCEHHGERVLTVGFAAESDLSREMLEAKWQRKPTDYLVGTYVQGGWNGREQTGFGSDEAQYLIRNAEGDYTSERLSKRALAQLISSWGKRA